MQNKIASLGSAKTSLTLLAIVKQSTNLLSSPKPSTITWANSKNSFNSLSRHLN